MDLMSLTHWHWLVAALLFGILEMAIPGVFFIWMGIAAALVGFITMGLTEIPWGAQLILFSVLSLVNIAVVRLWFKRQPVQSDQPQLNERLQSLIGQTFVLIKDSENLVGTIKVADSQWLVALDQDAAAGAKVKVTAVDGAKIIAHVVGA